MIKKYLQKIFKKISYSFFFKIYGSIDSSIKSNEDSRIKVKIAKIEKNISYRVYIISNGRLYTDRIHDTAAILDNKIIEGPSFQLRPGLEFPIQFSKINDNIVFEKGTPRKLKKLNGSVLSLLTGGAGNNNYWHWLYDVLPKFALCSKFLDLSKVDFFLLPNLEKNFQKETLDALNISQSKRISSKVFRHIKAKELIITDHPVVITGDANTDILNIPDWIVLWLKSSFLDPKKSNNNKNKIYIDREDENLNYPHKRSIINEQEIKKYLLDNNFILAKLHKMKFKEQVDLFHNAECVAGLHGGGFGNISFCKPGTKIIELKSLTAGDAIKNLAKKNKLNYDSIEIKSNLYRSYSFSISFII